MFELGWVLFKQPNLTKMDMQTWETKTMKNACPTCQAKISPSWILASNPSEPYCCPNCKQGLAWSKDYLKYNLLLIGSMVLFAMAINKCLILLDWIGRPTLLQDILIMLSITMLIYLIKPFLSFSHYIQTSNSTTSSARLNH